MIGVSLFMVKRNGDALSTPCNEDFPDYSVS
jgi:hypothetical protein